MGHEKTGMMSKIHVESHILAAMLLIMQPVSRLKSSAVFYKKDTLHSWINPDWQDRCPKVENFIRALSEKLFCNMASLHT